MRSLRRQRQAGIASDVDELAPAVQLFAGPVGLDQRDHFLQLLHPPRCVVEGESHRLVLGFAPPCAKAEIEPAIGEQIERGCFLGEDGGYVVVDAEDPTADPQGRGDRGSGSHCRDRGELLWCPSSIQVVVGDVQCGVSEVLDLAGKVTPLSRRSRRRLRCRGMGLNPESERSRLCHSADGSGYIINTAAARSAAAFVRPALAERGKFLEVSCRCPRRQASVICWYGEAP